MAFSLPQSPLGTSPARLRSYILRLPLFTRLMLLVILLFWVLELQTVWSVTEWGALRPSAVGLTSMHRLNTYPLIHAGFIHALLNGVALTPLLERFEAEHGTLNTIALFLGPLSTFPGAIYILIERVILRGDTAVLGASIWVFLLLGVEAIKTYRSNPNFIIGTYKIPTWTTPLILVMVVSVLISSSSFLGHLCAVGVGYIFGLGYMRILMPPEKILRWIEAKLNLLGRLPHYVSVDQKTYGRYGILPTGAGVGTGASGASGSVAMGYLGSTERLGP